MGSKNRKAKKGGGGMSKVKKNNIKGGKMSAGKKHKPKNVVIARKKLQAEVRKKLYGKKPKELDSTKPPESEVNVEEILEMINDEDLAYMKGTAFRDRQNFVNDKSETTNRFNEKKKGLKKRKLEDDEDEELETKYEDKLVKLEESSKRFKALLPTKTKSGLQSQLEEEIDEEDEKDVSADHSSMKKEIGTKLYKENENSEENMNGKVISMAKLINTYENLQVQQKLRIGTLATSFLEDPNNRLQNLDSLLNMLKDPDQVLTAATKQRLVYSLTAIFIDVLPTYAIKHGSHQGDKLKKQTYELQTYESSLLSKYKIFLQRLERLAKENCPYKRPVKKVSIENDNSKKMGLLAFKCMCMLLNSHPYFNLSTNIANFIIPYLNNWCNEIRQCIRDSIRSLFKKDKRGQISYEIVRRINDVVKSLMAKNKNGVAHFELLDVLMGLRIKEADLEKEKEEETESGTKMSYKQRHLLSKRQKKKAKELVELEKELLEASAEENKERKSHFLTEITKLVFTIYFRVLKSGANSRLLNCVLEGLSKFAHIINVDFFDDILKVIQELLYSDDLNERQILLCVSTVLAVLDGQGAALTVDPTFFHKTLYTAMNKIHCGNAENCLLALQCLKMAIGKQKMPMSRAVAFAKRLTTLTLQLEYHDAAACLVVLKDMLRVHPTISKLLDFNDGAGGGGVYIPDLEDPDHSCADSSTIWEILPLMTHYNPWVSQVAKSLVLPNEKMPLELMKMTPQQICLQLDPKESMEFYPRLPEKKLQPFKPNKNVIRYTTRFIIKHMDPMVEEESKAIPDSTIDFTCGKLQNKKRLSKKQ